MDCTNWCEFQRSVLKSIFEMMMEPPHRWLGKKCGVVRFMLRAYSSANVECV